MNLDDKYILVFIRQNMFPDHQMVHSFHLGFLIGRAIDGYCQKRHQLTGHPIVLAFGEPNEDALNARAAELSKLGIELLAWKDPDSALGHDDFGVTGFVTEPITKTQRNKLPRFKQWSANNNVHPHGSPSVGASPSVALDGQRGTTLSAVSSEKEHQLDKLEVGGSIPSPRAIS